MVTRTIFAFLILLLTHLPLMANEEVKDITVILRELKKSLKCKIAFSPMYICNDNGKIILLKNSNNHFEALGLDNSNSSKEYIIEKAYSGKTLLFASANTKPAKKSLDLPAEHWNKVDAISNFFNLEYGTKLTNGPAEYESIVKKHIDSMNRHKEKINSIYDENNFTVKLSSGDQVNCKRESTRNLTEFEKKNYSIVDHGLSCGSFNCGAVNINGNKYNGTLIFSSNPHATSRPTLYLTQNNNFGPKVFIEKILSPNSNLPLVDNTNSIEEMESLETDENLIDALPAELKDLREKIIHHQDFDRSFPITHFNKICSSDNIAFNRVKIAKENLFEKLAKAELVEFISILANGSLVSEFRDLNKAISSGCFYEGVYLDSQAAKKLDRIKDNIHLKTNAEDSISMAKANELFNKAIQMDDIAWNYASDGCYARGHLIAKRLKAEGYRVDKVWLKGDLYLPENDTSWNFHVAPVIYVKDGNEIKKMVIDPVLFQGPVTVEEWDKRITKRTVGGTVVTAFPFPENAQKVERAALAFSDSSPYVPGDSINLTEEQKEEHALDTMKRYKLAEEALGLK